MSTPFGINQSLRVRVFEDGTAAAAGGYNYRGTDIKPLTIEQAVIVQNGTHAGNATIDLILVDQQGNRYVTMITGNLLKSIPL